MGTAVRGASPGVSQNRLRLHPPHAADEMGIPDEMDIQLQLERARRAQVDWAKCSVQSRLKLFRKLRLRIASEPLTLAKAVRREDLAETLAAEVLPFLDACRYLETEAVRILKEKTVGSRSRPKWLWGNSVVLRPEPLGVVLIIAPSNYPLMLPGIQALQALAAGNAVLFKPAAGCTEIAELLTGLFQSIGLPAGLLQVLPESPEAAVAAIRSRVDKVFLTGSASTGLAVRRQLAESGTPSVMELSGCDAVFVLDDADLDLVSDCVVFGMTLNQGQTCMAPRRVFATHALSDRLLSLIKSKLSVASRMAGDEGQRQPDATLDRHASVAAPLIREAVNQGAVIAYGTSSKTGHLDLSRPVVLDRVTSGMFVAQSDLFVPVTSFLRVDSESEMMQENLKCPYALSATVFGSSEPCQKFARSIPAGCVVINDMIAPSADPRVPFGGRGNSGNGVTRGEAGLLEMTQLKAIVTSRSWFRPHLNPRTSADVDVLENLIRLEHAANPLQSLVTLPKMIRATIQQLKLRRNS